MMDLADGLAAEAVRKPALVAFDQLVQVQPALQQRPVWGPTRTSAIQHFYPRLLPWRLYCCIGGILACLFIVLPWWESNPNAVILPLVGQS